MHWVLSVLSRLPKHERYLGLIASLFGYFYSVSLWGIVSLLLLISFLLSLGTRGWGQLTSACYWETLPSFLNSCLTEICYSSVPAPVLCAPRSWSKIWAEGQSHNLRAFGVLIQWFIAYSNGCQSWSETLVNISLKILLRFLIQWVLLWNPIFLRSISDNYLE